MGHFIIVASVWYSYLFRDYIFKKFSGFIYRHSLYCNCNLSRMLVGNGFLSQRSLYMSGSIKVLKSVLKFWHLYHFSGTYKLDLDAPTTGAPCCTLLLVIAYSPK